MNIWTDKQTLKFIEMYKERPCLWNPSEEGYRDKNLRHDLFMELSTEFGLDKAEIEKKLKGLQTQFARERKKEKDSYVYKRRGGEVYTSKWFAYKNLLFLVTKKKRNIDKDDKHAVAAEISITPEINEDLPTNDNDSDIDKDNQQVNDVQIKKDTQCLPNVEQIEIPSSSHCRKNVSKISKRNKPSAVTARKPVLSKAFNLMTTLIENQNAIKDEFSFFGEQVATRLRKIASPSARFVVQNMINRALFEGEMGVHNGPNEGKTNQPQSTENLFEMQLEVSADQFEYSGSASPSPVLVKSEVIDDF